MDDLAAMVAEERYGPPPGRDPARPLRPDVREPLMAAISLLATALEDDEARQRARRRHGLRAA